MFAKSIGRVARSAPPTSACTSAAASTTCRANPAAQVSCCHQRRLSSSKASCPPGSSRSSDPATDNSTNTSADNEKRSTAGRPSKRKPKEASASEKPATKAKDEPFAKIPAVPPTNSLQLSDVHTSSFFSLHRPISVTTSIPPVDNPDLIERFNDIFKTPPQASPSSQHKIDDVIYTISSDKSEDLRSNINQAKTRAVRQQLGSDKIPYTYLEDMVKHYRPFHVPPPPVPFDETGNAVSSSTGQAQTMDSSEELESREEREELAEESPHADPVSQTQQRPSHRTFTTTVTIQETTTASGQKTYTASATPIRSKSYHGTEPSATSQPFLKRMHDRQQGLDHFLQHRAQREGGEMRAISVKRQRKLKMKKHKYKKLMRRTRVLRRNQGRL